MKTDTTKAAEPPAAGEEGSVSEIEPQRTCAELTIEDERWRSLTGFPELIPDLVASTLAAIERAPETHAVSIALLSDAESRALNKAFRGKDTPTNVLYFPSAPPRIHSGPIFLGDVALAYETVAAEALEQEKPSLHHAAHLIVHGVLHLAGYDHGSDADAERMEAAERLILGKFGIPDPYAGEMLPPSTSL